MCWVMPPASPAATSVSRIASSSDVLPWSTWPMIVTTGGARLEVLVGVLELRLVARLVGGVDDLDLLVELVGEHLDRVVGQRLRERGHLAQAHELLDDLGDRDAEVLGDVLDRRARVDLDDVGLQRRDVLRGRLLVGAAAAAAAAPRRAALRAAAGRRRDRRRGRPGPRREACESITTRRTPPAAPGARSPCSEERVGRWRRSPPSCCGGAAPAAVVALRRPGAPGGPRAAAASLARACAACGALLALLEPLARGLGRRPVEAHAGLLRRALLRLVWPCRWLLGGGLPVSARSASSSSTADADALTLRP